MEHPNKPKDGPEKTAAARPEHGGKGSRSASGNTASTPAAQPHEKAGGQKPGETAPEKPASQRPAPQHAAGRKRSGRAEPDGAEHPSGRKTDAEASAGQKQGRPQPPKGAHPDGRAPQTRPAAQEPPQNRPAGHAAAQKTVQTAARSNRPARVRNNRPDAQKAQKAPAQTADAASRSAEHPATPLRERLRKGRQSILRRIEYQRLRRIRKRTVPAYAHCKNCGEVLQGMYCHRCGQYALDIEQPFWKYIRQYFENVYQFDGKVWQTLYLLFRRPGLLTKEFNAGKINSYVHPLRLYMFVSVIFFTLFFMFASTWVGRRMEQNQAPNLPRGIIDSLKEGALRPDTTVWVLKGRQFAELLRKEGVAGCDTLFETVPVHRKTGLALMRLPHIVADSCFYETPLTEDDSVKIMALKEKYADEVFVGEWARTGGNSGKNSVGNSGPKSPDKRSAVLSFRPGTTPVYDWRSNRDVEVEVQSRTFANMLMAGMSKWTPFYMLFLLPLFALLIRFAYRRCGMRYMNHFVHAIHINTVFLLLVAAPMSILLFCLDETGPAALPGSGQTLWLVPALFFSVIFIYMAVSFRTVYARSWFRTVLKTLFVFCTFSVTALVLAFGLFLWIVVYYAERL